MKKILTADNTETFLNEEVGESYHSQTGAVEEAMNKYVIPCKVKELAKTGHFAILDVCFGLGYNSALAISAALQENSACEIEVIGLEFDPTILEKIQEVNPPIAFYGHYKQLNLGSLGFTAGKVSVKVLLGDAREMVKQLSEKYFDAIFFDPFSPQTAPAMWEAALFEDMLRVMKDSGILATYSSVQSVRENMARAGFFYDDGPVKSKRGPGTVAVKWV